MSLRPIFRATFAVAVALASLASLSSACGQPVPSCADVCPDGSGSSCPGLCTGYEMCASANANAAADLQALLTCVGSSGGSLTPLPEFCQPMQDRVDEDCSSQPPVAQDAG